MTIVPDSTIRQLINLAAEPDIAIKLTGLQGSASAYVISRLVSDCPGPFLIVTPDGDSAAELCRELRFYSGLVDAVRPFPAWESTPFEAVSPHPDITGERFKTLFALLEGKARAVVTSVAAICQKVLPRAIIGAYSQYLESGEEVDRGALLTTLVALGYSSVPLVEDRGTFAVRGGILDIFPPDRQEPVRIEFFGDFVDSIRTFEPTSQRSLKPLSDLIILPSREIILAPEVLREFPGRLKKRCDSLDMPGARRRELVEQVQNAIFPVGIEYLQPLFHPGLETIFDYLGPDLFRVIIEPETSAEVLACFSGEITAGEQTAGDRDRITCAAADLFIAQDTVARLLATGRHITIPSLDIAGSGDEKVAIHFHAEDNRNLKIDPGSGSETILKPLASHLEGWLAEGYTIIFTCHQQSQAQRLYDLLSHYGLPLRLGEGTFKREQETATRRMAILIGELSRGFRLPDERLVVIAEEELFGRRVKRRAATESRIKEALLSLAELKPGDLMVHVDHGIGIYRGLQHLSFDRLEGDFLLLEYAGGDKLYLPVDRINLVQRYIGAEGIEAGLDRLGGAGWERKKAKAREAIEQMAQELLELYAARQIHEGFSFAPPDDYFREFEASFAYEETPDQLAAIEDVLRDMESQKPMDRLVCGDVGYGKTEVALRAAFKAVMDGKQVAILVPTTVLAHQHLETFRQRCSGYPVTIEMVSRFRSPKEQKAILGKLEKGDVDIIIGTHRLLQQDVTFKDLGLIIIDEEHRFGVSHKERLKRFRTVADVMTLTATPIPRTLHMSLTGIRDLSIIDTPPADRLSIKTFVARISDELIREAIMRELRRGGQVFFVHNRVQSIHAMAEHLQSIVPEARLAVGHGQLREHELEKVMLGFMTGETNLLLCTTIIESGLDIPTANTIIVNRADTFGLAQLYQLRGRVGRGRQRAYAYFLIPGEGAISSDARERLKVLQELSELGAGFRLATHDLEIRGGGDLLGARQSGNIAAVGFDLYTELLEDAITRLKGEERAERIEPEINLAIPAFIPEEYVPNTNQRLVIYKKLTQATGEDDIAAIRDELIDRFGRLPDATIYLLEIMGLRVLIKALLITAVEFDGSRLSLAFHQKTPAAPETIMALIAEAPRTRAFTPDFRLVSTVSDTSFAGILAELRKILKRLG